MKKKSLVILLLVILVFAGVGLTVFNLNSNKKYEKGAEVPFEINEDVKDLNYLLDNPLTMVNKIVSDEEIENYKESDTVYIIKSPKKIDALKETNYKKIVFIKTQKSSILVLYKGNNQEVRMK